MTKLEQPPRRGRWAIPLLLVAALPWAELRAAEAPATPAAIASALQALVNLKDGDEAGFAAQAKVLLSGGEKALDAIEAELKKQSGEKAFRLTRVRDMMYWPLDVKGVITMAVSDKEIANRFDVGSQVIVTAVNGTPTPDYETFSPTVNRAQKTGKASIPMDLIKDGRKRTVGIPNGKFGYYMGKYPYVLTHYIHKGERAAKWDEDIKEGLRNFQLEWWQTAGDRLQKAMEAGCRDPMILSCTMHALILSNRPTEALSVYNAYHPTIKDKMWEGGEAAYYESHKGRALLYTGDLEGAEKQLTPLLKNTQGPVAYVRGYLAMAIQEKDPERAMSLLKEAASKDTWNLWDQTRYELLKKLGRYDEAAALGLQIGGQERKDLAGWMKTCKANAKVKEPEHWAVIYRNDFAVPEAAVRLFEYHSDMLRRDRFSGENGTLVSQNDTRSCAMMWGYYKNAQLDIDVHISSYEKFFNRDIYAGRTWIDWYPEVTVSGLFNYHLPGKGTEIGFGYTIFRRLTQTLHFDKYVSQGLLPTLDPGAPHHLTLKWLNGKATFAIDGKLVSEQFYPTDNPGKIGLRTRQGKTTFDNLEIRVPAPFPVENDKILAGYKKASEEIVKGNLIPALEAMEQVSDLQAHDSDLSRMYAAYIESVAKRSDWTKIIKDRMACASSHQIMLLLLGAEEQLSLFTLNQEAYDAVRIVSNMMGERVIFPDKYLTPLKSARDLASLAMYGRVELRELQRGKATFAQAESAMKLAVDRCTETPGPLYRLCCFYLEQKRNDLAEPVVKKLQTMLPNAAFLEGFVNQAKAGQKPVKPPVPASEDF